MPVAASEHPAYLWRNPQPKPSYEVVIVGAGGHGLATAYYLAKTHGITSVAVVDSGYLAGGNMGRNTTVIRSNYLWTESTGIYEHALKLWEGLTEELDYDIQFRQGGVLNLAHNLHDEREALRRVAANQVNGVDAEWVPAERLAEICPILDLSHDLRYPVVGATYQPRGGIARHDAVAWAFARAADRLGVDIIQGCQVESILREGARAIGVRTSQGDIAAGKVALATAGRTSQIAATAELHLPIQTHPLQALVSEILEPLFDCVVMSNTVHVYVSQAHKGELVMGAGVDAYNSYAQRGSFHVVEHQMAAACELFPIFSRAHVLRTWAGMVDVTPDASPVLGLTSTEHLYVNCGWGTGGFKATPAAGEVYADTIAHDRPHPLAEPFALERFTSGALIDEHGAAAVAH